MCIRHEASRCTAHWRRGRRHVACHTIIVQNPVHAALMQSPTVFQTMERYKAFVRRNAGLLSLLETGEQGLGPSAGNCSCYNRDVDFLGRPLARSEEGTVLWIHYDAEQSKIRLAERT